MKEGRVYFFTGLSGAGKTTLAKRLYELIKTKKDAVILWDGDYTRDVFKESYDEKYDRESRLLGARRDERIIQMLSKQGIDVVVSCIAMFDEVRDYYRSNITGYTEIFVDCPMNVLYERDQKGLYSGALKGEVKDVVGIDIEAEYPKNPDIHLINDGEVSVDDMFKTLITQLDTLNALN